MSTVVPFVAPSTTGYSTAPRQFAGSTLATARDVAGGAVYSPDGDPDIGGAPLEKLVAWFKSYQDQKTAEMAESRTARQYYHASQWTDEEIKKLKERNQPIITINRTQRKIDGITGLIERFRQDPKAFPRSPNHAAGADLATMCLRYTADDNHFNDVCTRAILDLATAGIGGVEFDFDQTDDGSHDVRISQVVSQWFFYDPRSVLPDFSDARFQGVAKWMDAEAAIELMPKMEAQLRQVMNTYGTAGSGDAQGMVDWEKNWYDSRLDRVLVVQIAYRWQGEWWECVHTGHLKLAGGLSPFRDDKGKTICRYRMTSAAIDQDGDRYGFVRNLKGPQDEINHRRSKLLHIMNMNQVIADENAVADVQHAKKQAAKPDGWIEVQPNSKFEFRDQNVQMQGQAELLAEAKNEIESFGGVNPALAGGAGQADRSGRAISLIRQAGLEEMGSFLAHFRAWKLSCYRLMWFGIRIGWTTQRFIRVTDSPDEIKFITINQPQMNQYGMPAIGPDGQPSIVNAIGQLDVDIILDEGPDTVTLREDTLNDVKDMVAAKMIPPQAYVALANLPPDVKAIIEKSMQPPPPDPMHLQLQQTQLQLAQITGQLKALEIQASTFQKNATGNMNNAKASQIMADAHLGHMQNVVAAGLHPPMQPVEQPPPMSPQQQPGQGAVP